MITTDQNRIQKNTTLLPKINLWPLLGGMGLHFSPLPSRIWTHQQVVNWASSSFMTSVVRVNVSLRVKTTINKPEQKYRPRLDGTERSI